MLNLSTGIQSAESEILVCPETNQELRLCEIAEAEQTIAEGHSLVARETTGSPTTGPTPAVLLRADGQCAYPIVDGIPILLAPEMLTAPDDVRSFDLSDAKYCEAYEEMQFYNEVATKEAESILKSSAYEAIEPVVQASEKDRNNFPKPRHIWLDSTYDCAAQWDAYNHLGSVRDKRVMQLGGKGIHAVKFLLAGARESWLVTPMLGEVRCAIALAGAANVADRLRCAVAVCEELPFTTSSFDAVFSGGCLHHTVTSLALPEVSRVLSPDGRFGAVDPWKAPLHTIGTKLLGKREVDVHCRPLNAERIAPFADAFPDSRVKQHGSLTRYPLLALEKFGLKSSLSTVWWFNYFDDSLCSLIPGMRKMGSSVALLGSKQTVSVRA